MTTALTPGTGRRRRKSRSGALFFILILFLASAAAGAWIAWKDQPNASHVKPDYLAGPNPIMIGGEWTKSRAAGEGEGLRIPLPVAQKLAGDGVVYEKATDSVILTTPSKVLHLTVGNAAATLNQKPFKLQFAAVKEEGEVYLPFAPLKELFGFQAETDSGSGIVTLYAPDQTVQSAAVPKDARKGAKLREGPDKSFAIVEDLSAGESLRIWGEEEGWYRVQSASGNIGYLRKQDAVLGQVERIPQARQDEPYPAWKAAGQRINLTWEAVYEKAPDARGIGELAGVNVVSPTWFELTDGTGKIRSKADAAYSGWYRSKGTQVWALFSNGFEPERTEQALATYETRFNMIRQLLAYAKTFKLQGINLDFENVKTSDKDNLVQFVREFTPLAHEQNLVVSIDVTPKSNSEFWSAFLDRARLGATVDFMMVMAYDEHWASSPEAGSVASLPWAEASVRRILEEDGVPPSKLILGIPLYTRMWTEKPDGKGGVKVTSKTMSMDAVSKLLADKKLTPKVSPEAGQHYVEFKDGDATQKIWIEDALSMEARMRLVKKYNLAGAASWARIFASDGIWDVIDRNLQSRP
ncbi:glycosyl hydrolase family 18 protein [Cohnella caldifontis]|uniref:glycosyl hydrolase family 18 protein n=1 Tax=Cohnella caldifontis TaxID=3027471 RepID=UPI0023ED3E62|nr:glycosyl hydrolase family 18 protein [Cohnella sp. YIM B05605]